ncbi:hypothetical protein [Clostridium sp. 1001283B150210_160208_E6]|uniref:hypothetical protein n=1 Tax=Clostridium sp. 1001283B150210_160208_E6 TaxID=2787129 RepID=UPI0018A897D4|nr:hypothetical protein [Clostridium sp. 1001283B150210_160208_E6]
MERIELSEQRVADMFKNGEALQWAKNVFTNAELSEDEKAFSETVDDMVNKAWKYGNTQAKESIAEVVVKIIEPEIFTAPNEILEQMFDVNSYGEFDLLKVKKSYKNTLVAVESANRTGNVDKSYIDFTVGTVMEKHLQIETEIPMSNLRRNGALGVATLAIFALQEFEAKRFAVLMNYLDSLLVGGDNVKTYTGAMTKEAVDAFTGYLGDYNFDGGLPQAVGLSTTMRELSRVSGIENYYSEAMKDKLNQVSMLEVYNGVQLDSIKAGKKMGNGETLLPKDVVIGVAGKIGEMYTKGEMRSLVTNDNNNETISLKFTGVEFGVCIDKIEKIAKLKKTA